MQTFNLVQLRTLGVLLVVSLSCASANAQAGPAPGQANAATPFREEVIAEITHGSDLKLSVVGRNHLAWIEKRDGKETVRLDGKQQGGIFEDVKYLDFGSHEAHLAFFGKRDSAWIFVLDGQEHSQRYKKFTSITFQPKGDSYSYCACIEKKCRLTVAGTETGSEYDDVSYTQYSRDGKRLAFIAKRQKKWIAVVDGKEFSPEMEDFWPTAWGFNRDGNRFYEAAWIKGSKWLYIMDGTMGPGFDVISYISFTDDGKHYAYGGTIAKPGFKKQKTFGSVVLDGQASGSYEGSGLGGAWTALAGETQYMTGGVRDLTPDFHGISTPQFSPEGKLIYAARRDKGDVAVFVGSEAGPGFDEILSPVVFSRDSSHFAYVARRGDEFVPVRDNHPGPGFTPSKHGATGVGWIVFGGSGEHLAFETISGGNVFKGGGTTRALRAVVLDGARAKEYDAYSLREFDFNKAGHYCYTVRGASGNSDLVNVDGHESRLYNDVVDTRFSEDGQSTVFVARDGGRFFRVTYELGAAGPQRAALPASALASN
jgi:hypothetical protein